MDGKKKRSLLQRILVFALALFVIAALGAGLYMRQMSALVEPMGTDATMSRQQAAEYADASTDPAGPGEDSLVLEPEDIQWDSIPASGELTTGQHTNILIIGTDRQQDGISRADVIMLCAIDRNNNKMFMVSFLRDMYVPIPGFTANRINAAYAFGGATLLKSCLESNFGVTVDHTVEVDFQGFASVIDHLGGVEITVDKNEASYLGLSAEGAQLLNGETALSYVRMRTADGGDFARTERQQKVLSAMGKRITTAGIGTMHKCLSSILRHVKTDLDMPVILGLLPQILSISANKNCKSLQIPAAGTYRDAWVSGMQVLVPDLAANRAVLRQNII